MSSYEIGSGGEVPSLNTPEPAPKPIDGAAVVDLVIADLRERDVTGTAKYGVRLTVGNGRRPLIDAYQEILDLAQYVRQEIAEADELRAENEALKRQIDDLSRPIIVDAAKDLQIADLTRQRDEARRMAVTMNDSANALNMKLEEAQNLAGQNAAMREALENAPHDDGCDPTQYTSLGPKKPNRPCNCWKSRALAALNPTA